jgi:hypothetical protein
MRDGAARICVEGECRLIGCDGMLGSQVKRRFMYRKITISQTSV